MRQEDVEDNVVHTVVLNHEEQYSLWSTSKDLPLGWREAGKRGSRAECLAYIEQVWTDMRPLSLRQKMAKAAAGQGD
jgi:MbtH protein